MNQGKLILIIGPSGVGKSVILNTLRERNPELHFPKSATTRQQRQGEGNDLYHFVTDEEFDQMQKDGKILEWAVVHGGARYGTLIEEIIPPIEEGKIVIREVDVQGFDSIKSHELFRGEQAPYVLKSIFILPDDKGQLITRITNRAPISEQELARRIASMEQELTYATECDFQIINREGELDETIEEVETVMGLEF
ncbi:guanylate kinase [Candidatus Peregrinibacteria bacterium]|jgi:guanylate kinase|nr:guanylate kinase [Candidatus Peregrinibacteria bacterium]MBT3598944.1 guanylate kinase [Candidatus Peregrinibacteria bacterium]MBT6731104.1 guanylate kinase [Candidatus Peregrinibacteria bacterium]MBT7009768.1 guanylate kinase [Candidatus Peregrinibacteria bacterium]MBT7344804.1 guanylate kinase [Candidatus Peregrinibacteria bacterium]